MAPPPAGLSKRQSRKNTLKHGIVERFDYTIDKIFILKSLGNTDTFADALFEETIQPYCERVGLATEPPIELLDVNDWDKAIEKILTDEHRCPLIHFEMHGDDQLGLSLVLGDRIPWQKVIDDLTRINVRSGFNLIITMAVCYSTMNAINISMVKRPAPYLFSVTTSLRVLGEETYRLFTVFFKEFIETGELYTALKRIEQTYPELPAKFDILAVPYLFEIVFEDFIKKHQETAEIEREFYHVFSEMQQHEVTREEFEKSKEGFLKLYWPMVELHYKKCRDIFFMIDKYPENLKRFSLPDKINLNI